MSDPRFGAGLNSALEPKNFPKWAQACPKSFAQLQAAILQAGERMQMSGLSASQRAHVTGIIGHVAATCFVAGQSSVAESHSNGLDVRTLK